MGQIEKERARWDRLREREREKERWERSREIWDRSRERRDRSREREKEGDGMGQIEREINEYNFC